MFNIICGRNFSSASRVNFNPHPHCVISNKTERSLGTKGLV